jgi:polyphosphate kinase
MTMVDLDDPHLYLNRELSLLEFNRRVLAEAHDERNRLLERVRFLAITASNMDEFYAKRMGWLRRMLKTEPHAITADGLTIAEQHIQVQRRCAEIRYDIDACWERELRPALASRGIMIVPFSDVEDSARQRLRAYFEQSIFPVLTPLVVDPAHPFPFISSGSLSLALDVRDPANGQVRFARVKVPQNRPRLVEAGENRFVLLEDLIGSQLEMLFLGMEVTEQHTLRVIRSAEIGTPGEDAGDLLELVENGLRRRRLNEAVVLGIQGDLAPERLELLLEELELTEMETYQTSSPLGLADLMQLGSLPLPDLLNPPFTPTVPAVFAGVDAAAMFAAVREKDVMVHHPYESFDASVVRFIDRAADDPAVLAIKQTLYRTSPDSPILASLIDAAGRGKQVAVLVELTARFDEANNIEWARRLEDAGVHVAYGNPDQKIHSKICLVAREEGTGVTLYAHVGTGNYNSRTARVYTDIGLFTADPGICGDLLRVFNRLTGFSGRVDTADILLAPENLREGIESRIRREIANAQAGLPASVTFKVNALEDAAVSRLLYGASQAGVRVDLLIRGICRLRPGIPGLSENIRVVSVIGRFLEHSRIYRFENGGAPEYFIGSADLMKRNLDGRTEVLAPIRRPEHQGQLDSILNLAMNDERQGWRLRDEVWSRDATISTPGSQAILLGAA